MATNNATNISNPVSVSQGGTGLASTTAYAVVCGGTTTTAALQAVSGVGTSGQVLLSNGASALPTWQTSASGNFNLLNTQNPSAQADAHFNSYISSSYTTYALFYGNVVAASNNVTLLIEVSTDGGSTWQTSSYTSCFAHYSSGGTGVDTLTTAVIASESAKYSSTNAGSGYFFLYNIGTSKQSTIDGFTLYPNSGNGGATAGGVYSGICPSSLTINAIRMKMSSGNISGDFSLYGVST